MNIISINSDVEMLTRAFRVDFIRLTNYEKALVQIPIFTILLNININYKEPTSYILFLNQLHSKLGE